MAIYDVSPPPIINETTFPTANPSLIDWMTQVQTQLPTERFNRPGLFDTSQIDAWLQKNKSAVYLVSGGLILLAALKTARR